MMINLISAKAYLNPGGWWLDFVAEEGSGTIHDVIKEQMILDGVVTILDAEGLEFPRIVGSESGYEYPEGVTNDRTLFALAIRFYQASRIDKTLTPGPFPITENGLPPNPTNPS